MRVHRHGFSKQEISDISFAQTTSSQLLEIQRDSMKDVEVKLIGGHSSVTKNAAR